jgi:putative DNA primase/helicase
MSSIISDPDEIRRALELLCEPDEAYGFCALNLKAKRGQMTGFFDAQHRDQLVKEAARYSGKCEAVSISLNPCLPATVAKRANRVDWAGTGDSVALSHIKRRTRFFADIDAIREGGVSGISATEEEKEGAVEAITEVYCVFNNADSLYKPLAIIDSGNGYQLIWRVDEPADQETDHLFSRITKGLQRFVRDEGLTKCEIDDSVASRNRLIKIPGTLAAKGDEVDGRVHRLAHIIEANPDAEIVPHDRLVEVADELMPEEPAEPQQLNGSGRGTFDLQDWLQRCNVPVSNQHAWDRGPVMYETDCINDGAHNSGEAYVGQYHNGALLAGCQHNSCSWKWKEFRAHYEPVRAQHQPITVAKQTAWPEPQPLPGGLPEVPVLKEQMLPSALRPWLVDIAERAQAPLDFPATAAIVALSSAIGRRLCILPKRKDDWRVVPNLWGFIVGPPGTLKSPMLHEVVQPLTRLEAKAREEHTQALVQYTLEEEARDAERHKLRTQFLRIKSSMTREELTAQLAALQEEDPPGRVRYMVSDPTVEALGKILNQNPMGVLLYRDEISGFLATMDREGHENDRAFYLEGWNGYSRYTYDRVQRGTLDIEAVCISISGAITPGPLSAYLRETFSGVQDDGLIQRFQLSVYPDPPAEWKNVDRKPDSKAKDRAFALFERFVNFGSTPLSTKIEEIRFSDEAQDFFEEWRSKLEKKIRDPDEHPVIVAHLAKYRSLMPSLALIFHLCDSLPTISVSLKAARLAAAWCDYLEPHARRIYHSIAARLDMTTRLLGEKIRAKKVVGKVGGKVGDTYAARDIYRHRWTGLSDPDDVRSALEILEELDWVRSEAPNVLSSVGRPPDLRYRSNPRIWQPDEKKQQNDPIPPADKTDKTNFGNFGSDTSDENRADDEGIDL